MKGKPMKAVVWVLSALLAALFLMAGGSKLAGVQQHLEHFAKWGYPDWFRLLIGGAEVAGAVGLLVPRLATLASGGLAIIMAGAAYTHLSHDESAQTVVPGVLLVALVAVGWARWHERAGSGQEQRTGGSQT